MKFLQSVQMFITFHHITYRDILSNSYTHFLDNEFTIGSGNSTHKEAIFGSTVCFSKSKEIKRSNDCCLLEFKNYGSVAIHVKI